MEKIFLHELRRLAPILQGLTPLCVMLHNVGCSACTEKPQSETSPLPMQQNNNDMKSLENENFLKSSKILQCANSLDHCPYLGKIWKKSM